jgi:S1-C subfamily serine protease
MVNETKSTAIAVVALIIALGVAGGFVTQLVQQAQMKDGSTLALSGEVTALRSEVSNLRQAVSGLSSRLQNQTQIILTMPSTITTSTLYEDVKNSVVSVEVRLAQGGAEGSGFVYDTFGHIITNNHVIEGSQSIFVTFIDGTRVKANVVGKDVYSDLAVIKINTSDFKLTPLALADSSKLRVGDPVVAIGNPFGLSGSLTTGVVSQVGRTLSATGGYSIPNVIQIDAAVNPGNSGGPLLNYEGQVIGITTAIATETGTFSGLGLAIPSNTISREVPVLISTGKYEHPWIGINGMDLIDEVAQAMKLSTTKGWLIESVTAGGPADKAGLKGATSTIQIEGRSVGIGGDVIVSVNGSPIRNGDDLSTFLEGAKPGDNISMLLIRSEVEITKSIILGIRPSPTLS